MQALTVFVRSWTCVGLLVAGANAALAQAPPAEPLARARQAYNAGRFDDAVTAAREAVSKLAFRDEANLLLGRALLERHRANRAPDDLAAGRDALRAVDAGTLNNRGRVDLIVGFGEALYLDGQYRAAAALLEPVLDQLGQTEAAAREQVLDWWATSMDRHAQTRPTDERGEVYTDISSRLRQHLARYPDSSAASYWLPATALARGDLELAWDLALAGWVRSTLATDRGVALRTDLDRLVVQALIPERVKRLGEDADAGATARFTAEWDEAKARWKM